MSTFTYFVLFVQACLILNATGALAAVIAPFGYEGGLGTCGCCGLSTGIAGPYSLGSAFTRTYGLNGPCGGSCGCGCGPYGYGAGYAGPFNGYAGPYGASVFF